MYFILNQGIPVQDLMKFSKIKDKVFSSNDLVLILGKSSLFQLDFDKTAFRPTRYTMDQVSQDLYFDFCLNFVGFDAHVTALEVELFFGKYCSCQVKAIPSWDHRFKVWYLT